MSRRRTVRRPGGFAVAGVLALFGMVLSPAVAGAVTVTASVTGPTSPVLVNTNFDYVVTGTVSGGNTGFTIGLNATGAGVQFLNIVTSPPTFLCGPTGSGLSCTVPTINDGQSATATITVRGTTPGTITGTAFAGSSTAPVSTTVVGPGTDLSVSVADSADPVSLGGDPYGYTVSVANPGASAATGVSVSTTLSGAAATINSATPSQGSCSISAPTVTCTLGSIAASGSASVTISVTPSATGTVTATATVSANESDPDSSNNTDAESTTVNNALGCTITGTSGNDTLTGTNGNDVICGLGGDDTINGGNGDDVVYAGAGDDAIGGGNGSDTLYGGPGNDTNNGETLLGGLLHLFDNGNDTIDGGPGNDDLDGQNGNDTLADHDGTDVMSGNVGSDNINVQDGVGGDTANGGLGTDSCTTDAGDTATSC